MSGEPEGTSAEAALRESEQRKAAMLDSALDCIITMDRDGRIVEFNPAAERTFGYSRAEAVGRTVAETIVPPNLRDAHLRGMRRYLETGVGPVIGRRVELMALRADGTQFAVELAITPTELPGGRLLFTAYLRDITERLRAQQELLRSQGQYRALLDAAPLGIYLVDAALRILHVNPKARPVFGDIEGLIGRDFTEVIHILWPPDIASDVIARFRHTLETGQPYRNSEFSGERQDSKVREYYDWQIHRLTLPDGLVGVVCYSNDISAHVLARKALVESERRLQKSDQDRQQLLEGERIARRTAERLSRLKDDFLATLSHELRTPLNAILGWTHLLRKDLDDPAKLRQGVEVIERSSRLQAQLVSDLLDMNRIISGKMRLDVQRVELPVVIEAALDGVRPAAEAKGVRLVVVLDPITDPVQGDPGRLQQIVWNLVSNAVKFTPRGGRVQVVLARVNSYIEITVTDTGKGITPEFLPHVFERFRQADASAAREQGGLGLGLAIVKQLAELHGGTVRAASAGEGRGATFVVRLPIAPVQPRSEAEASVHPRSAKSTSPGQAQVEPPRLSGIRVLVVDDERDACDVIQRVLEESGAEVVCAGSAEEGLAVFQREHPDVVLSDIGMPRVDGYEFIAAMRRTGSKVPAAALTAFARSEDRTRALTSGYNAHLAKPVEPAELIATVASLAGAWPPLQP